MPRRKPLSEKMPPDFFFAMNQTKGKTTAASQENLAAVIHQTSTNEARLIAHQINAYAQSRSACIQRRQWLQQQIAKLDAALSSKPAKTTVRLRKERRYGDLTTALKQVLTPGALTKREIVARLQEMNVLPEHNPLKVLDSVIYTKHFARQGKLFSLAQPTQ